MQMYSCQICGGAIFNYQGPIGYAGLICNCTIPTIPSFQQMGQQGYNPYTLENIVKILERIELKLK